jgi:hypothetical protein
VTSRILCQQERGANTCLHIFVVKDGKQNSFHTGSVGEYSHWSGSSSHLDKPSLNGIRGSDMTPERTVGYGIKAYQMLDILF